MPPRKNNSAKRATGRGRKAPAQQKSAPKSPEFIEDSDMEVEETEPASEGDNDFIVPDEGDSHSTSEFGM